MNGEARPTTDNATERKVYILFVTPKKKWLFQTLWRFYSHFVHVILCLDTLLCGILATLELARWSARSGNPRCGKVCNMSQVVRKRLHNYIVFRSVKPTDNNVSIYLLAISVVIQIWMIPRAAFPSHCVSGKLNAPLVSSPRWWGVCQTSPSWEYTRSSEQALFADTIWCGFFLCV